MTSTEEKIKKEAKTILENFSKELEKITFDNKEINKVEGGFRVEEPLIKPGTDFKKRMFSNAPETEGDFIIAEKKKW